MTEISAIVITFNEEQDLEACLQSVTWCDEIVVVDSHSTDGTVEIARCYTEKVIIRDWLGFSEQKNFAVECAGGEWILHLDADERITPELKNEILGCIRSRGQACDGYYVPRLNHWLGKPIRHGGWYPDYSVRLFRKGMASCVGMSHESFFVQGKTGRLKCPILHYSYHSILEHVERAVWRSAPLDVRELSENGGQVCWFLPKPVRAALWRQIVSGSWSLTSFKSAYKTHVKNRVELIWLLPLWPFLRFSYRYILKQGFRDGAHGFWIAVLSAVYDAVRCALLWERFRAGSKTQNAVPDRTRNEPAYTRSTNLTERVDRLPRSQ